MWVKVLFAIGCLVLPVIWGIVVNWLFVRWRDRKQPTEFSTARLDDPDFLDYQI